MSTAMKWHRRSAFRRVRARRKELGIKDDEYESKDKQVARRRDAANPEGVASPSRRRDPVGDKGHVLQSERSVRKSQERTNAFVATSPFDFFFTHPTLPVLDKINEMTTKVQTTFNFEKIG